MLFRSKQSCSKLKFVAWSTSIKLNIEHWLRFTHTFLLHAHVNGCSVFYCSSRTFTITILSSRPFAEETCSLLLANCYLDCNTKSTTNNEHHVSDKRSRISSSNMLHSALRTVQSVFVVSPSYLPCTRLRV